MNLFLMQQAKSIYESLFNAASQIHLLKSLKYVIDSIYVVVKIIHTPSHAQVSQKEHLNHSEY